MGGAPVAAVSRLRSSPRWRHRYGYPMEEGIREGGRRARRAPLIGRLAAPLGSRALHRQSVRSATTRRGLRRPTERRARSSDVWRGALRAHSSWCGACFRYTAILISTDSRTGKPASAFGPIWYSDGGPPAKVMELKRKYSPKLMSFFE